ncbi:NAD(P)H-binding protein [Levilactobacillus bambusae]|nr:NAD(P)H-binding protein [Levilactobacillus bambusae]
MAVLVIGATGRTGFEIIEQLVAASQAVVAGVHSHKLDRQLAELGVQVRHVDLIQDGITQLRDQLAGVETIVFAAGASQSRPDLAEWLDLDGAVKLMDAAKLAGVSRFLMVSAAGASDRSTWDIYDIPQYYLAKYYAERELSRSGLTYTVVRPPLLSNGPRTGRGSLEATGHNAVISRADVAAVVIAAISDERTYHQAFDLFSGNEPVSKLFDNL